MNVLEQHIEELGAWACGLELNAQDTSTPYWMRQKDAEHARRIREEQYRLLQESEAVAASLTQCAVRGCTNLVEDTLVCRRCEEELRADDCSLRELFVDYVSRIWRSLTYAG